jgi:hypothetical protein
MGPGGVWRQRAGRVGMIAACALALEGWVSAFPDVAFHGLEPERPAVARQPRTPASVAIVHLRDVDIFIRTESPRPKHASGAQTSGVVAVSAARVVLAKSDRIDLRSQKPQTVKAPAKPRSTPSAKPAQQPSIVSPAAAATPSLAVTETSPAKPADSLASEPVDTSSGAPGSNSGGSGSDRARQDPPKGRGGDHGKQGDRQRDSDQDHSRQPEDGDRSGGSRGRAAGANHCGH